MITVMGLSGSLRRGSYNAAVLRAAGSLMPPESELRIESIAGIRRASLLMFVGESNQHPEHLLATSDRSFKCTSNGRAITDYSEMM
jgi:NAD(P)H-dependent FMN reductase